MENTTNAFLCIELVDESRLKEFESALKELSKLVEDNLGGTSKIEILDISHREVTISLIFGGDKMKSFSYKEVYTEEGKRVLEVNVLPEKYCNFDCIFCPIGRTHNKVDTQHSFDNIEDSLKELEDMIKKDKVDLVFINSKGEALINDKIGYIIDFIKSKGVSVRLLSNGYLLGKDEYMVIANKCDEVIGEKK